MKRVFLLALLVGALASPAVEAGEDAIGAGCSITATAPATGSSASDADCVWKGGVWLAIQCDVAVRYTKDGSTPTAASPLVATGDPYRVRTSGDSASKPLRILPVTGSATCYIYRSDSL